MAQAFKVHNFTHSVRISTLHFFTMAAILGMGNPLLDISANADKAMFEKYGLEAGGIILAEDKHQPVFAEMAAKKDVQYIAGGATQNTIRVAQWMSKTAGTTAYMGCVGKDDNAEKLRAACKADGVNAQYMEDASIVYSAGFFITVSPESIEAVSNHTQKSGAIYCLNLSAPFIVQVPPFRACLEKTLPNCDFLFGNETEARAYAEACGLDS